MLQVPERCHIPPGCRDVTEAVLAQDDIYGQIDPEVLDCWQDEARIKRAEMECMRSQLRSARRRHVVTAIAR